MKLVTSATALTVSLTLATTAIGNDWPQWRGPDRTGAVKALAPPASWPEALTARWKLEVGTGHASPVLVDGTVYAFSRDEFGGREVLRAVELRTGKVLWERGYVAPYTMNSAATSHGKGPKSTPVVAEGRIFTLGIDGMLSAFDARDGKLVWQSRFEDRFGATSPLYGHGTSPIVVGGKLIVHLGGPGRGALMALDAATGDVVWDWDEDGPGYTSPMMIESQLVTQTETLLAGFDAEWGELLWRIPFRTPYDQNIFTTVPLGGGRFVFSGLDEPTKALSLQEGGAATQEVWSSDVSFYMSTPVLAGDRLIGFSSERRGHVVALDTSDGKTLWQSEGRMGENAAVVAWADWVLVLTDEAELHVLAAGADAFSPVATYEVATSPTWAHPVPTEHGILIKDETTLSLLALPE